MSYYTLSTVYKPKNGKTLILLKRKESRKLLDMLYFTKTINNVDDEYTINNVDDEYI